MQTPPTTPLYPFPVSPPYALPPDFSHRLKIMSRAGRKKLPSEQNRSSNLCVRLTLTERLQINGLALEHGCTPTEWVRAASLRRQLSRRKVVPQTARETWMALSETTQSVQALHWILNLDENGANELRKVVAQLERVLDLLWEGGEEGGKDVN